MPTKQPTLFIVTDIETTMKKRLAFDIAWRVIDRKGKEYCKGSYIVRETFKHDIPFYKEKMGHYFDDVYSHLIEPLDIYDIREIFNSQVANLQKEGHRVIGCAYNAAFDFKYLPHTLSELKGKEISWMKHKIELLDIWDYWGNSVPLNYKAVPTESGKYMSTSAESAYRWEFGKDDFEERHIAWHDVLIESDILLKALRRKKQMPIVSHPSEFAGAVWKKINTRLGITGAEPLAI